MQPAIETSELTKRYRELRSYSDLLRYHRRQPTKLAVDRVSITVGEGGVFGVLGPNGAGKTTLLKMLSTALLPTSGSARVAGYDVVREAHDVRTAIGLVGGEERSFAERLTGRQNLEFFAALHGIPPVTARRRINQLLGRLDLWSSADRLAQTYSSGLRQRLAIARGLLAEPRIVFMDEPTRALDPISARDVRDLVADYLVGELERTVVLATHSLAEAEELCNRVVLIQAGRVVAEGTVSELRRSLLPGVRCNLRLAHIPAGLLESIRALPRVLGVEIDFDGEFPVLELTLEQGGPVLAAVIRTTVDAGADIHGCDVREPTLEEVYLERLGGGSSLTELAR